MAEKVQVKHLIFQSSGNTPQSKINQINTKTIRFQPNALSLHHRHAYLPIKELPPNLHLRDS